MKGETRRLYEGQQVRTLAAIGGGWHKHNK